ncbi:hypothetical protein FOBRF1_013338 [Fusarium oxysporum]
MTASLHPRQDGLTASGLTHQSRPTEGDDDLIYLRIFPCQPDRPIATSVVRHAVIEPNQASSLSRANGFVHLSGNVDDVSGDDLRQFLKASNILQFVTQLAYVWGFVTVKMSFAVLYLRLLRGHVSRRMNQLLLAVLAAEGLEETMVVIFHCKPVDKAWNPQKEGTCLNLKLFYYISSDLSKFAIKFVTDVCLFIQPIPAVWKLQLSKAKRLGAILMLSLGLFVCIIAIIRVSFISQLRADVTKDLVVPMIWSQVEVSVLVVCASIPSLRPFLQCFPAVSKALGLSSSKDSRPTSNVGRSPRVVSLHLISWSKAKQSHVETNNSIQISTGCNVTATGPWSAHSSTEQIFPQRHSGPSGIVGTHEVEVGVGKGDAGERLSNDEGQIDAVEDRALHHIGDSI